MDLLTIAMAATEAAASTHWAEIGIVLTNLGLILVTLWLGYLTNRTLHEESKHSAQVANNSIDSMEAVAQSAVTAHHRDHDSH